MGRAHCNVLNVPSEHSKAEKHAMKNQREILKSPPCKNDWDDHVKKLRGKSAETNENEYEIADETVINAAHILVEMLNCGSNKGNTLITKSEDGNSRDANRLVGDDKMKNAFGERLYYSSSKSEHVEKKKTKNKHENNSVASSKDYRRQCIAEEEEDNIWEMESMNSLSDDCLLSCISRKKGQKSTRASLNGGNEFGVRSSESKKKTKKRRIKENDTNFSGCEEYDRLRPVVKSAKNQRPSLITPTIHSGFSFSIIHLLSAVRIALVNPYADESTLAHLEESQTRPREFKGNLYENPEFCDDEFHYAIPYLTMHEILWYVIAKPGDPLIRNTEEPLLVLVRGVLNIFTSKVSPLQAKNWKPLAKYEKQSKRWYWIGPITSNLSIDDFSKVQTSSEAWGLPQNTILKMVNSFADWLKNNEETCKEIGSLPSPPAELFRPSTTEERFKGTRLLRSFNTICRSSDEVRSYFQREETLRYSIPDRAFSYTALDGKKSMVAPLKRFSGKPKGRIRDHFILNKDRPPQVTVTCLVRDAVARLPDGIGTRGDICTLVRDSQFIVEGVSDLQVNEVVSGALDRLHYEFDPCVKYNKNTHLWVYLHGKRKEEDFESDGTSIKRK